MQRFAKTIAAVLGIALASSPASAVAKLADVDVQANVDSACSVTATPVNFGSVDPSHNSAFYSTGGLHVTCTAGTSWTAGADVGQNGEAIAGGGWWRNMVGQSTGDFFTYSLFTDAARLVPWNPNVFSGVGTGATQDLPIYGEIPNGQTTIHPDSYRDTVQVDLEY